MFKTSSWPAFYPPSNIWLSGGRIALVHAGVGGHHRDVERTIPTFEVSGTMEWLSPDTVAAGHIPVDGDWDLRYRYDPQTP